MTFDEWLTAAGLGVAGIAAVAGIVAAVYAIRADRASRTGARDESRRWLKTIQPRPKVSIGTPMSAEVRDSISIQISNPGGAVTQGFVLAQVGRGYYGTGFNLAEHSVPLSWGQVMKIGEAPQASGHRVLLIVAQDVDGNWWDVGEESILKDFPPRGVGSVEFNGWLNRRIAEVQARDQQA